MSFLIDVFIINRCSMANDEFGRSFWKLLINSTFGKDGIIQDIFKMVMV